MQTGGLTLDLAVRRVTHGGNEIDLTPTEFSLLEFLIRHAGNVVTRKMLCEHLWDADWEGETNVIEVPINRLRGQAREDRGRQSDPNRARTRLCPPRVAEGERPIGQPVQRCRWSIHPRSFKALVAAWNTLTILLFTIAILVGLRYGISYMMLRDEDSLLNDDAAEIHLLIDRVGTRPNAWETVTARWNARQTATRPGIGSARCGTTRRTVLAQSDNVPDVEFPKPKGAGNSTQTAGPYRIVQGRYKMSPEPVWVYVGATTELIDEDVRRLSQVIGMVGIVLLILAPFGGFLLATRASSGRFPPSLPRPRVLRPAQPPGAIAHPRDRRRARPVVDDHQRLARSHRGLSNGIGS